MGSPLRIPPIQRQQQQRWVPLRLGVHTTFPPRFSSSSSPELYPGLRVHQEGGRSFSGFTHARAPKRGPRALSWSRSSASRSPRAAARTEHEQQLRDSRYQPLRLGQAPRRLPSSFKARSGEDAAGGVPRAVIPSSPWSYRERRWGRRGLSVAPPPREGPNSSQNLGRLLHRAKITAGEGEPNEAFCALARSSRGKTPSQSYPSPAFALGSGAPAQAHARPSRRP